LKIYIPDHISANFHGEHFSQLNKTVIVPCTVPSLVGISHEGSIITSVVCTVRYMEYVATYSSDEKTWDTRVTRLKKGGIQVSGARVKHDCISDTRTVWNAPGFSSYSGSPLEI